MECRPISSVTLPEICLLTKYFQFSTSYTERILTQMKKWFLLSFLILTILVTACSNADNDADKQGYQEDASISIVKDELLLYQENESDAGQGDLYIKTSTREPEKVASDVLAGQFQYLYNTKTLVYLNKDHQLLVKAAEKSEEQVSTDVLPDSVVVSKDESTILYLQSVNSGDNSSLTGDLYFKPLSGDKVKIASNISTSNYSLTEDGKIATFVDAESSLYRKASEQVDKEKIASDVSRFIVSNDGNITILENLDGSVYIKNVNSTDKEKVASQGFFNPSFADDNQTLAYLDEYRENSSKGELMVLKAGYEKAKIASDVTKFHFPATSDFIYFLNVDKSLYKKEISDAEVDGKANDQNSDAAALKTLNPNEKVKIGENVTGFDVAPDSSSIVYTDTDDNLFLKRSGEQKVKIGSNVSSFHLYNDSVIFWDKDMALYTIDLTLDSKSDKKSDKSETDHPASPVNVKVKLAESVEAYSADLSLTYLAYQTTSGEVFVRTNRQEQPIKILDKATDYNSIYFLGFMLYEKLVTSSDLVGFWKYTNSDIDGHTFMEFTKDAKIISYNQQGVVAEQTFQILNSTTRSADISFSEDPNNQIKVEIINENTLAVHETDDTANQQLTRVTKEEVDTFLQSQKKSAASESEETEQEPVSINTTQTAADAIKIVEALDPGNFTASHDSNEYDITTVDGAHYYYINYTSADGMGGDVFVRKGTGEVFGYTIGTEDDPDAPFPDFSNQIK